LGSAEGKIFVRESTGLVKNVSFIDSVMLNLSNMSSGTAIASIGFTMVALPTVAGVNLVGTVLIGFLLSIPEIFVYTIMSRRMPRTGGDYVWMSRTIGPISAPLTFAEYIWGQFSFIALIALSTVFAIGSVLLTMGNHNALGIAVPGMDPTSQFIIAAVVFSALIAVNIFRPKAGYKIVSVLGILGIVALLVGVVMLFAAGRAGVEIWINNLGANLTYSQVAASYTGPTFSFGPTVFILPLFAAFTFPWLNAGPAVASEIKGRRALQWNVPVAAILTFGILLLSFGTMYIVGGFNFINGAFHNPTLVFDYSFNFWTLAMGVSTSPIIAWFIGLGWIIWNISVLAYAIIVVARYIFAEAFDRVLPERLAHLNRWGSPVYAHLLDFIITLAVIGGVAYFYGTFTSLYGTWVLGMSYFALVGLVAVIYGTKKERGTTKVVLQISGFLMILVFLYLAYAFAASPAIWGGNLLAYGYILSGLILGFIIYAWSRSYHRKKGIDIAMVFKEIPPD
jgi:amino acid transporter